MFPRWISNLLLITGAAAVTLLAASFFRAMMDVGLMAEPTSGWALILMRIFLLSIGPGLVLFVVRRQDKVRMDESMIAHYDATSPNLYYR